MFGEIPLCDGGGFSEETQQEIADQIGISQMQVSRRISALLGRLRAAAEGPGATEAA